MFHACCVSRGFVKGHPKRVHNNQWQLAVMQWDELEQAQSLAQASQQIKSALATLKSIQLVQLASPSSDHAVMQLLRSTAEGTLQVRSVLCMCVYVYENCSQRSLFLVETGSLASSVESKLPVG